MNFATLNDTKACLVKSLYYRQKYFVGKNEDTATQCI